MATREQLENTLKEAMRASDDLRKRTVRMVLAAIRLAEVEKGQPIDETAINAILQKEIKSRNEAIADAQKARRPDLIAAAQSEITYLESLLPQALTDEELENLARQVIAETGATSARQLGQVMKALMPRLQGRADGARVNQVVRRLLG
jgi:uncharacterized protein YqeY